MSKVCRLLCAFAGLSLAVPAHASESITYTYDAKGRLTKVVRSGTVNNGVETTYTYDKADNRTNQTVIGGASAPQESCTFTAVNVEGGDEFSVYPYLQKTGSCGPVTVTASVQVISGQGDYSILPGSDLTFQPSETFEYIRISPWYGTVAPGNPLVFQINWTITAGNGTFSDSSGIATIYNADCYC